MIKYEALVSIFIISLSLISRITDGHGIRLQPDPKDTADGNPTNPNFKSFFDPKSIQIKKQGMCDGYDGILKINSGDRGAATGTVFFIYVVNQLIYAEKHNLLPWVHFDDEHTHIYEKDIHDVAPVHFNGHGVFFKALVGARIPNYLCNKCEDSCRFPGPPDFESSDLREEEIQVGKSGVWENYFAPVSPFRPAKMGHVDFESCASTPYVDLTEKNTDRAHLIHIHRCAPWALRSWIYGGLPKSLGPVEGEPNSIHNWSGRMRQEGNRIVSKYFVPKPWLMALVDEANPIDAESPPCLTMHIRHTDKGGRRAKIPLEEFLPYAKAYVSNGGGSIFIATDAVDNIKRIENEWPLEVTGQIKRQKTAFLSENDFGVFELVNHHRSNTEALVEIYAMSRCGFMIHGWSAMSEASMYVNGDLHENSVNLEDPDHMDEAKFGELVKNRIH